MLREDRRVSGSIGGVIVNGTVGVGKTTVAEALSDVLGDAEPAHALIDLDAIRRIRPAPEGDRFAHEVELTNLRALAAGFRAAGAQRFVLAGVVEAERERERYAEAIGAEVLLVRLTAPPEVVAARIRARHGSDATARDWHLVRAVELERILAAGAFEDLLLDATESPQLLARRIAAAARWTRSEFPTTIGNVATRELAVHGITRFEQLAAMTQGELLRIHGVGPQAVRILAEALAERGSRLR
ncbi:AAA family ATPase [Microbacteriaceae bacterium VKM Ac-2854]|nr:AAA family ATPase [Microbacteriaceae bacterium VKM Ac-2854]